MSMILSLPSFFALSPSSQSSSFLSVPATTDLQAEFQVSEIWNPRAKFAAEPSQSGDVTFVNIRSCYTNKYWVANELRPFYYISASADKPQEDRTKPGCTLFQAHEGPQQQLFLFNVYMNMYVYALQWDDEGSYRLRLDIGSPEGFNVVDWEKLVILPPHVTFRSEHLQGNYLCPRIIDGASYLAFESGLDASDPLVAHDLSLSNDGSYRIQSLHYGQQWRKGPENWIWADGFRPGDVVFFFVKISDNVFAIRNMANKNFCGGLTRDGKTDCLNAEYPKAEKEARLIVEERVKERNISQLEYRLSHSRIYNEETQEVGHIFITNPNPDKEVTFTIGFKPSDSRTTNWTNSTSLTYGTIKPSFKVSKVPDIADGAVELSPELNGTYEWGVTETKEAIQDATHTVAVPPLTTLKVTLISTKATCEVPFSYTQTDLLLNDETVTAIKDDGVFTGINSYNFRFESSKA